MSSQQLYLMTVTVLSILMSIWVSFRKSIQIDRSKAELCLLICGLLIFHGAATDSNLCYLQSMLADYGQLLTPILIMLFI